MARKLPFFSYISFYDYINICNRFLFEKSKLCFIQGSNKKTPIFDILFFSYWKFKKVEKGIFISQSISQSLTEEGLQAKLL